MYKIDRKRIVREIDRKVGECGIRRFREECCKRGGRG